MICEVVDQGNGQTLFICGRKRLPKEAAQPCRFCGAASVRLCDFPTRKPVIRGGRQFLKAATCDAPLCEKCTTNVGGDSDLCPQHANEWAFGRPFAFKRK